MYSGAGGAGATGAGAGRFPFPVEVVLSDSSVVEGIGVTGVLDGSGASLTGSGASEVPSLLDPVFVGAPPLPTELPRWIGAAPPPPEVPEPPLGVVHPGEVGAVAGGEVVAGAVGVELDGSSAEAEPDSPTSRQRASRRQGCHDQRRGDHPKLKSKTAIQFSHPPSPLPLPEWIVSTQNR